MDKMMKYALQLYTVRDSYETKEEFKGILRKVKEMGYAGVEFAGFAGFNAEELRLFLNEINLEPLASHHAIEDLDQKLDEILEFNARIGCRYVVCSYSSASTPEELAHLKNVMERAQQAIKIYDMELAYHNHSHEFTKLSDGTVPLEEIKKFCKLEVDTYWALQARTEPCFYLKDNVSDIALIHLKDGDFNSHPSAIGEGYNNIKGILEASKEIGMKWVIVENDFPAPDGLSDAARSIRYLTK